MKRLEEVKALLHILQFDQYEDVSGPPSSSDSTLLELADLLIDSQPDLLIDSQPDLLLDSQPEKVTIEDLNFHLHFRNFPVQSNLN